MFQVFISATVRHGMDTKQRVEERGLSLQALDIKLLQNKYFLNME
jgi:hypothetical protein